ncbi:MAG: lipoyl synthase [Kiritimatiellia bacterium]|nr:lipoyl synthase [Kiritimatiellia bacterium]
MKQRLPPWIRIRLKTNGQYAQVQSLLREQHLHTVCESAQCPNRQECFNRGVAAIMILGNICTRGCRFCAVRSGAPQPVDSDEPRRAAELVKKLNLRHAVITSVTRDDLPDGGASVFAETVAGIRSATQSRTTVEVLTPDFNGSEDALAVVLASNPDVFNHNLETVERLQRQIRPQASYLRSLAVVKYAAVSGKAKIIKSGLMAGMGENDGELYEAMRDLLQVGCRHLTIGQYLAPSKRHLPVHRFVPPEIFDEYRQRALSMGFKEVAASPLVRSSYLADSFFQNAASANRQN